MMKPKLAAAALAAMVFVVVVGVSVLVTCAPTRLEVLNAVPGASLENVRWVPDDRPQGGVSFYAEPLLSGELSSPHGIGWRDEGRAGTLRFDLVVDGRRVALRTRATTVAEPDRTTRVVVDADTVVDNAAFGVGTP